MNKLIGYLKVLKILIQIRMLLVRHYFKRLLDRTGATLAYH